MSECPFCGIASGKIKSDVVYSDERLVAFKDLNPAAPVHVLIIPRKHIATLNDLADSDADLMGRVLLAAKKIAADKGIAEPGYRIVINCNKDAGQAVGHIHFHLLGGRHLGWPPG